MPLVQDRPLDLLTSSPALYHYATDAPLVSEEEEKEEGEGEKDNVLRKAYKHLMDNTAMHVVHMSFM